MRGALVHRLPRPAPRRIVSGVLRLALRLLRQQSRISPPRRRKLWRFASPLSVAVFSLGRMACSFAPALGPSRRHHRNSHQTAVRLQRIFPIRGLRTISQSGPQLSGQHRVLSQRMGPGHGPARCPKRKPSRRLCCSRILCDDGPVPAAQANVYSGGECPPRASPARERTCWHRRCGSCAGAMGRNLAIGGVLRKIIGVMPADFRVPFLDTRLWAPLQSYLEWSDASQSDMRQHAPRWDMIGRLRPGVRVIAAQDEIEAIYTHFRPQDTRCGHPTSPV